MGSARRTYQHHLRQSLARKGYAVWPPGRVLQLGDVVTLKSGGGLRKHTDLRELQIDMSVEFGSPETLSATTQSIQNAAARAGARVAGTGAGTLKVSIPEKGSVIFEASGFQHLQIGNLAQISRAVVEVVRPEKKWDDSWCVVDQLWWVAAGTIIVSEAEGTQLAISADGDPALSLLTALGDPSVRTQVDIQAGSVVKIVGGREFAAMFTASRLNWWKSKLKPISTAVSSEAEAEPRLVRLTLDQIEQAWSMP